jgi:hypothetical protein
VPEAVATCRCGHRRDGIGAEFDFPSEEDSRSGAPATTQSDDRTTVPGGVLTVSHEDLTIVASSMGLTPEAIDRVWNGLCARSAARPRFDGVHVAYYFGALIVIAAMGFFMTLAWDAVGGFGLAAFATAYGVAFWFAGETLWKRGMSTPGGLLFTMAVCMAPLAVYGIQDAIGMWAQGDPGAYRDYYTRVRGSWITLELATIGVGAAALLHRPFPFLMMPVTVALWFMSMDLTPLLFGKAELTWDEREWVSVWFGLAMLLASYWVDLKNRLRQDFAFWGYLFGLLAFWGGLSIMDSGSELSKFLYCLINLALIVVSVLLRQHAFVIFGSLGVFGYLGHLSYRVFENSLLFPVALTFLGISIIYGAVMYQRNAAAITVRWQRRLPDEIKVLVPPRARSF